MPNPQNKTRDFSTEEWMFIETNYKSMTNRQLADHFNVGAYRYENQTIREGL